MCSCTAALGFIVFSYQSLKRSLYFVINLFSFSSLPSPLTCPLLTLTHCLSHSLPLSPSHKSNLQVMTRDTNVFFFNCLNALLWKLIYYLSIYVILLNLLATYLVHVITFLQSSVWLIINSEFSHLSSTLQATLLTSSIIITIIPQGPVYK